MNQLRLLKLIIFTMKQLVGEEKALLCEVGDDNEYVDDKPTGKRLGTKYTVACPKRAYEKIAVKVPGAPAITAEELAGAASPIWVTFEGFKASAYQGRTGEIGFTCRADQITVVPSDGRKTKTGGDA